MLGDGEHLRGQHVLEVLHRSGRRGSRAAGLVRESGSESAVVDAASGSGRGQDRRQGRAQLGVGDAPLGVMDGAVNPRVVVDVTPGEGTDACAHRVKARPVDRRVGREPAGEPDCRQDRCVPRVAQPPASVLGDRSPGRFDVGRRGRCDPRRVCFGRRSGCVGGRPTQGIAEPAEPALQTRGKVQGVGCEDGGPCLLQERVGAGKDAFAVRGAGGVLGELPDGCRSVDPPAAGRRRRHRGVPGPLLEPGEADLRGLRRRPGRPADPVEKTDDETEGDDVPEVAGPQDGAGSARRRSGAGGEPVQERVREQVTDGSAQRCDSGGRIRQCRPAQDGRGVRHPDGRVHTEVSCRHCGERVVPGQDAGRGGGPRGRVLLGDGKEGGAELAVVRAGGQRRVDAGGGEHLTQHGPRVGGPQPVPQQVSAQAGPEVCLGPVGEYDEPGARFVLEERLPDGEGRHAGHDADRDTVMNEGVGVGPDRLGTNAEDTVPVALAAGLVDQTTQHRDRGPRRGCKAHSTRHSTTTVSSG